MPGVDTSFYPTQQVAPLNPLQAMGEVTGIRNAQVENQLLQQATQQRAGDIQLQQMDIGKRQAYANALQFPDSTDPVTGAPVQANVLRHLAHDDTTGYGSMVLPEAEHNMGVANPLTSYTGMVGGRPTQAQTTTSNFLTGIPGQRPSPQQPQKPPQSQIDDNRNHLDETEKSITGLLSGGDLSTPTIIKSITDHVANDNTMSTGADGVKAALGVLYNPDGSETTPQQRAQILTQTLGQVQKARTVMDARGHYSTRQQQALQQSQGNQQQPAPQTAASGEIPENGPITLGGPMGGVATSAPAGMSEAATGAATGATQAMNDAYTATQGASGRIFQLQQALTGLENSKTGPGQEEVNHLKSVFNAVAPDWLTKNLGAQFDPDKIASYDEANKYLTQYGSAQAGAMGGHTDMALATALTGNPSTHISNLAAQNVVKATMALERMQQARVQAWQDSGQPPENFNKWSQQWGKSVSPQAFVFDSLDPVHKSQLIATLKQQPLEYAKFKKTYNDGVASGFIDHQASVGTPNGGQ